MAMIDKIRSLFNRRGETEKKIAFLSERRAALGQQRDRAYEEIGHLETKDAELREQFKNAGPELIKRRITSQLLQLRKDIERRQQLLNVLNQQVNVVSTHLHNLELVQQGEGAKLPDSEEMANDAAAAEEMLATLQESSEMAATVGGIGATGMTEEEEALYEELTRETGAAATSVKEPPTGTGIAGATQTPAGTRIVPPINPAPERERERKGRSEPEAG
jgi:chromosome segregation ATPase